MKIRKILEKILTNSEDMCVNNGNDMNKEREFGYRCNLDMLSEMEDMITIVEDERFLIGAEWDIMDTIPNAGNLEVDVEGYCVFYYIVHDCYFYIEKMKDKKMVENFLEEIKGNYFYQNIIVLYNGFPVKYFVKKEI